MWYRIHSMVQDSMWYSIQYTVQSVLQYACTVFVFRNVFPDNLIQAAFQSTGSCIKYTMKNETVPSVITYEQYSNLSAGI